MNILNLYAGIGGNRKFWNDVKVTAVEINPAIAKVYQDFFPKDEIIITDAHQFLLENLNDFDLIWTSPPCTTHSQIRYRIGYLKEKIDPVYPNMQLYEEIILLQYFCKNKWVVENTNGYYPPLIKPYEIHRHYFWSNFVISKYPDLKNDIHKYGSNEERMKIKGMNIKKYDLPDKRQVLRNCVRPEIGKHILDCARRIPQTKLKKWM